MYQKLPNKLHLNGKYRCFSTWQFNTMQWQVYGFFLPYHARKILSWIKR